jgi:hypothetical protein
MKSSTIGCAGLFGDGDRLACIAHLLNGRCGLTGRQTKYGHDNTELPNLFEMTGEMLICHDIFIVIFLQEAGQRYQFAPLRVKLQYPP